MQLWDKNDRKALTAIRLRVNTEMITHLLTCTRSQEAWSALETMFAVRGPLAQILARRKFMRYQIEEGADMETEVRNLKKLHDELTLLGVPLSEMEFALTLLTALPPSWDPVISAIGNSIPGVHDLIGRLLQEDIRRKDRSSQSTSLTVTTSNNNSTPKKSKFRKGIYSHGCGKEGHIRPECRSGGRHSHANQGGQNSGHHRAPNQGGGSTRAHVAEDNSPDEYAFVVEEIMAFAARDKTWLCDSASQSHIVRNKSLFI